MHARMDLSVKTPGDMAECKWPRKEAVPMPAASLGNCRSAGLRTLELKRIRFGASPSRVFEAQWQLMRLGSITVAGAVLD